jgi:predicted metal-dependent RNase
VDVAIESSLAWKHTAVYRRELPRSLNTGKRKPLYLNGDFHHRAGVSEANAPTLIENLFSEPTGWNPIEHNQWLRVGKDGSRLNQRSIRIVIAGSGMCQGGRILEHLREGLSEPGVVVVLMGFQAPDTPGSQLRLRVDNPSAPLDLTRWQLPNDVRATITDLGRFYSGHADQQSLVKFALHKDADAGARYHWAPLRRIFLNHGDQPSREALKLALIDYASQSAASSRELGAVELPKRNAGWFDLGRDTWTEDVEPEVDGSETVVATLHRKVQRLERELMELKQKVS